MENTPLKNPPSLFQFFAAKKQFFQHKGTKSTKKHSDYSDLFDCCENRDILFWFFSIFAAQINKKIWHK